MTALTSALELAELAPGMRVPRVDEAIERSRGLGVRAFREFVSPLTVERAASQGDLRLCIPTETALRRTRR